MIAVLIILASACNNTPIAQPTYTLQPTYTQPPLIPTYTPVPTKLFVSEMFRTQIEKFLEEGTKLTLMTEQGVNYVNFKNQLPSVMSPLDLAGANWPKGFPSDSLEFFNKALTGWQLVNGMWGFCVKDVEIIYEISPSLYKQFADFEGDSLITAVYGDDQIVVEWRGKRYLPCENIGVLFGISTKAFDEGKELLLKELP
jgi:hypothetical protein